MTLDFHDKTKQEVRDYAKKIRADLNMDEISSKICDNLRNQDFFKYSKNILGFYPFNNEIDLRELYKENSKEWYLPRVDFYSKGLIIHKYRWSDVLVKNKWGVFEPAEDQEIIDPSKIDIAIIPALMVDKKGVRIGYGAGFYDRFIPGLRSDCLKIVPIPDRLLIKSLPQDHWDIPINKVITENGFYNV